METSLPTPMTARVYVKIYQRVLCVIYYYYDPKGNDISGIAQLR